MPLSSHVSGLPNQRVIPGALANARLSNFIDDLYKRLGAFLYSPRAVWSYVPRNRAIAP